MKSRFSILLWIATASTIIALWLLIKVYAKPYPQNQNDYNQLIDIADSLANKEQYNEAKKYLIMAIEIVGNDSITLGDAYNDLGILYEYTGKSDTAFYYYEKALRIREHYNDTNRLSESYRNIAQILRVLRRIEEATKYCRKAYHLIPEINDSTIIANIYNELAYLYELNSQYDSAKYFYRQLIQMSKEINLQRGISVGYSNLASVCEREENFQEALILKKRAIAIDKKINDIYGTMTSYRGIADCYILMENYSTGQIYLDSASMICDSSWTADLYAIENLKHVAYEGLGNYQLALSHYKKAIEYRDSVYSIQKRKNIAEILTKYETDKKEQHIELLNKSNQLKSKQIHNQWIILIGLILCITLGAIISILIIRNKNHKLKQMSLELRNYLLEYQGRKESVNRKNTDPNYHLKILKDHFGLTRREAEIMEMISQGLTNEELGEKLFISKNTIKYHIKNIYIKLDVKNRVQALQKTTSNYHLP